VTLIAWRAGKEWSRWHIARMGQPACGIPIPDKVASFTETEARPHHWAQLCASCKESVLRGASDASVYAEPPEAA